MDGKRDQAVYVRLSDSEKRAAERLADEYGVSLAAWIRNLLRRSCGMSSFERAD